ncbi:MAG TPA: uroporphyrinogen-III C-methyltransferase, partial [Pseudohaliea sp.]|nr:uroporphyrinogen-III C-methyltransferase [Pseudohaliea sp.]
GPADGAATRSDESAGAPAAASAPVTTAPAAAGPAGNPLVPKLALAVAVLAAAAAFWGLLDGQQRDSDVLQRLTGLEAVSGRESATLEQLNTALERQVELAVKASETTLRGELQAADDELRDRLADVAEDAREARRGQGETADAVAALRDTLAGRFEQLEGQLSRQRRQLEEFQQVSAGDRDSWLLAETNYLLRLANQRLVMTGDTASAEALLQSADGVLRELDDPALHAVRRAIADDLAAVRAVPKLDREGAYLRLAALIDRIDSLEVFETPSLPEGEALPEAQGDWQTRLRQGYERALAKLSDYVIVRRRDEPVEVLMDPQWERLVRQNLRMLLEQAQVSLLSGNGRLYRESVERATGWVREFEGSDPEGAAAMIDELEDLAGVRVSVAIPDATGSLAAMQAVLAARAGRSRD